MATLGKNSFLQRMIGAAALDSAIYEEVEADEGATVQAVAIVLLSSLATGFGAGELSTVGLPAMLFAAMISLVAWAAWAVVTYEVGTRILPGMRTEADVGQLMRTIGFAATPGLLRVLGIMPAVRFPVILATAIWMLLAMVVGIRQALDYQSTMRAFLVCVIGWVLAFALAVVLTIFFGPAVVQ